MHRLLTLTMLASVLALPAAAAPGAGLLLALQPQADSERLNLVELDPVTLAPAGGSLALGQKSIASWSRSPDGGLLALSPWDVARITIVDRASMRVAPAACSARPRNARTRGRPARPVRAGAGLDLPAAAARARELVLHRRDVGHGVRSGERARRGGARRSRDGPRGRSPPDGLVLVLGRLPIGPGRIAVAGPDGRVRIAALPGTRVGSRRLPGDDYRVAVRTPGLAVDPEAFRAYVVGADEPVAEVDLRTLRVTYHALDRGRVLQARRKNIRGSDRRAAWVGDGVFAFTGWNARQGRRGGPRFEPAGVHLIDTRSWQRHTLAPHAQWFAVSGQTVVVPLPTAVAVFGPDGVERLRVPGRFGWVQAAGGRAYAWQEGGSILVVDLGTGATSSVAVDRPLTLLGP